MFIEFDEFNLGLFLKMNHIGTDVLSFIIAKITGKGALLFSKIRRRTNRDPLTGTT